MHEGGQSGSIVADEEIGPDGNRSIGLPLLLTMEECRQPAT